MEQKVIERPEGLTLGFFVWSAIIGVCAYYGSRLFGYELPWLWAVILGIVCMQIMQGVIQFVARALGYRMADAEKPEHHEKE